MDFRLIDLSAQCVICQEYKPLKRKSKYCEICGETVCDSCVIYYDKKTNSYRFTCPVCRSGTRHFVNPMFRYEAEKSIKDLVTDINYTLKGSKYADK